MEHSSTLLILQHVRQQVGLKFVQGLTMSQLAASLTSMRYVRLQRR